MVFLALVALGVFVAARASKGPYAQLPPPNPLIAPLPAPSAPAQLPAPVTTNIAPALIAVQSPPPASPTPLARIFNCSCFGPSSGTHWMGQVSSTGVFAARQTATGACLNYNALRQPAPPALNLPEAGSNQTEQGTGAPLPPGSNPVNQAGSVANQLPGTLAVQNEARATDCAQCVCD